MNRITGLLFLWILFFIPTFFSSCSSDDDVRMPADILGVWTPDDSLYLEFSDNNVVHNLQILRQDGESIGKWNQEVYFYEPGYNLIIYLTYTQQADVYQVIDLSETEMTICWVDDIKASTIESEGIGNVIGDLINKAQEGFKIDPELFQTFRRVPEDTFFEILENLDIMYPW